VGRLGSGMGVSASFKIISCFVGRLGLGSEPHVVGRLGSGPRVWRGVISRGWGIFGTGLSPEQLSSAGYFLESCSLHEAGYRMIVRDVS